MQACDGWTIELARPAELEIIHHGDMTPTSSGSNVAGSSDRGTPAATLAVRHRSETNIDVVVGAAAEVLSIATRTAIALVIVSVRLTERAASVAVRLPILGPRLVQLNRVWRKDQRLLEDKLQALTQATMARIIDQIDVDDIVGRVDIDSILAKVDTVGLAREVIEALDIPEMVRQSSGNLAAEGIEGLRLQGMQADRIVARVIDAVLGRRFRQDAPPLGATGSPDSNPLDSGPM
jgi:hypothetical protein